MSVKDKPPSGSRSEPEQGAPGAAVPGGTTRRTPRPPGARALLAGLLAAPLVWFVQIGIVEALAAQGCFAHDEPLPQPWMHGALRAIVVVSAVCLAIGAGGAVLAWRNRRIAVAVAREAAVNSNLMPVRRVTFITRISPLSTLLFLAGLIATDIAGLIVSPCSRW